MKKPNNLYIRQRLEEMGIIANKSFENLLEEMVRRDAMKNLAIQIHRKNKNEPRRSQACNLIEDGEQAIGQTTTT
jgi:hypothetical protein